MSEITLMLQSVGRGESEASEKLSPMVYDELRRLAAKTGRLAAWIATAAATAVGSGDWLGRRCITIIMCLLNISTSKAR